MSIEVEVPQTTINNKTIEVEYSNSNTAIAEGTKDLEVTVNRREYNIVGDELYIPKRYEDAPRWLRDIIDTVTSAALSNALSDVSTLGDMLDGLIAELNVAKNTHTMSIISDNDINERINTAIETLNSSLADADSTILDIAMTRVTPEEAQTIALGILSASINGGDIAAAVQRLQSAIVDVDSARSLDYTRLMSQIGDGLESESEARAEAISYLTTDVTNINGTLTTQAGQITLLETAASTVDNKIATAKSEVTNTLNTTITNGDIAIQSKWAYNSVVNINGTYRKSGFGLSTNYTSGSGTEVDPFESEFWIDAAKFRFTNGENNTLANNGEVFTIDASGTTPQVKFNGKVAFTDVTDVPSLGTSSNNLLTNSAPTLGNETYGWQVGWYNTNIVPNAVAAGFDSWRPTGAGSVYVVVGGSPTVGTVFDIRQSNNIPVVAGKRYEISSLLSSHRCTSVCTLAFFNSAGTYISEIGAGTANSVAYSGDLSNWTRQGGFVTIPAGTSYAQFYIRSVVTGTDPYCFVSQAYMGEVPNDKTEFSSWSEGVSANSTISWQSEVQTAINDNATTIDGGKIVTGSIAADKINTTGLIADNISANTISGKKITGGSMYGTYIEGAIIKASFIDLSSTATLTNWQQYTPATYPSAYDANFAKNTNGTLLVDSQGYVRLMGNTQLVSGGISHTNNYVPNSNYTPSASIPAYEISIHGYNDYKTYTINRMIKSAHTMSLSANQVFNFASVAGKVPGTGSGYCSGSFYVNSDYYEIYIYQSMYKGGYSSPSGYIKKNGVTVASSTAQAAVMVSYSISILGFSCTLSGGLSVYGVNFSLKSNNVINSGTTLSISNLHGPAFKLVSAYAEQITGLSSSIPVITII